MLDPIRKNPWVAASAAAIAVMAALAILKGFLTDTWPWMVTNAQPFVTWLTEWGAIALAGLGIGAAVYYGLQYSRYRSVLRKVTRDYVVEVSDLRTALDPEHYGPMSDDVKQGRAGATQHLGDAVIGKYGLPPEKEYR